MHLYRTLLHSLQLLYLDGLLTSMDTLLDANVATVPMQLDVPVVIVLTTMLLDAPAGLVEVIIPLDASVRTVWLQDPFPILA